METTSIQDLPDLAFLVIAQYLSEKDLDACFAVCKSWKNVLNINKIWKKLCLYPESFFKSIRELQMDEEDTSQSLCKWRRYYELEKRVLDNWCKGEYVVENTGIDYQTCKFLTGGVDEHGNHWMCKRVKDGFDILNISETPIFHTKLCENKRVAYVIDDKLTAFDTNNYIQVFHFKYPEYEAKLQYSFIFTKDTVLPENEVDIIPDEMTVYNCVVVDNFFIGYGREVKNIYVEFIHIWDLSSAKKVATVSICQQSFLDFFNSLKTVDLKNGIHFPGTLSIYGFGSRLLVGLTLANVYQVSLFSLDEMRFVNVVAQLQTEIAYCLMEHDTVVIVYNVYRSYRMSVYNVNGCLVTWQDIRREPCRRRDIWLSRSKVILKVGDTVYVKTVIGIKEVAANCFKIDSDQFIDRFIEPKFLVLSQQRGRDATPFFLEIFDITSGLKLWTLDNLHSTMGYHSTRSKLFYPFKILVRFENDSELKMLSFIKKKKKETDKAELV